MEAKTAKVAAKRAAPRGKDLDLEVEKTAMKSGVDETEEEKNADTLRNAARSQHLHRELQALMPKRGERVIVRAPDDGVEWEVRDALPMVDVLFDPYSYTNTVENLFYYAALVKEGFGTVLWARRPEGAGDAAGKLPAEGREWEPFISVVDQHTLQQELEKPMAPADAKRVVDPPPKAAAPAAFAAKASPGKGGALRAAEAAAKAARWQQSELEKQRVQTGRSSQFVVEVDMESWETLVKKKRITVPAVSCRRTLDTRAPPGFKFAVDDAAPAAGGGGGGGGGGGRRKKAKKDAEDTEPED
jgi:hypothetical protein